MWVQSLLRELRSYTESERKESEVSQLCLTLQPHEPQPPMNQAPPSMEFSRQEYWTGLPFPSPGDLPDPGVETRSPTLQVDAF